MRDSFTNLTDREVIAELKRFARDERQSTVALVALLAEMDARRLYLGEGCSSLFTYCTEVLRLSEHAAYGRIEAARAVRRFPLILERLRSAELTITAVSLLRPHLTTANARQLLDAARYKSKREIEVLISEVAPRPDVPASLRPMPAMVAPLTPDRYLVQLTLPRETVEKLRRVQDLVRHRVPDGDIPTIIDSALALLLEHLEKTRTGASDRPRDVLPEATPSRHIPAAVKRAVWRRDEGRCAFVGSEGRCSETAFLEYHHRVPFADGGAASVENIQLRCRAHNQYEAALLGGLLQLRDEAPLYVVPTDSHGRRSSALGSDRVPAAPMDQAPPDVFRP